ncbi:hypothetical protein EDC04DRAFT_2609054 [Pisolithus marmoratus]|nr:hypothetical protein EDC04DRAFT_2609054 [Pisolithus marmoratus]
MSGRCPLVSTYGQDIADHGMGSGLCAGIGKRSLTWVGIRPVCRAWQEVTGHGAGLGGRWGCWPWFGMLPVCRGWQEVTGHELGFSLCAGVGRTLLTMGWYYACVGIDSSSLAWVGIRPVCRGCYGCIGIWPVCRGQLHTTGYVLGWPLCKGCHGVAGHVLGGCPVCRGCCWPCTGISPVCRGWQHITDYELGWQEVLAMGWEDAHMQGLTSAWLFRMQHVLAGCKAATSLKGSSSILMGFTCENPHSIPFLLDLGQSMLDVAPPVCP